MTDATLASAGCHVRLARAAFCGPCPVAPARPSTGRGSARNGSGRRTEIRNAEKALTKTVRAAKRPQIPAFRAENRPPDTQPKIPERGNQNAPPHVKLPETRKAEKALTKTRREAKTPQIPAFREKNGPPDTQPENFENGNQNSPPDEKSTPTRRRPGQMRHTRTYYK